jgi:hypothetical protein
VAAHAQAGKIRRAIRFTLPTTATAELFLQYSRSNVDLARLSSPLLRLNSWIAAVNASFFLTRQLWLRRLRLVFRKPAVAFEAESLWPGAIADVDFNLHLRASKDDAVVFDEDVAARHEAGFFRLLENAEDPFRGEEDCVADKLGSMDADERGCAQTALDDVVTHDDARGFVFDVEPPTLMGRSPAFLKWHFSTIASLVPPLSWMPALALNPSLPVKRQPVINDR